MAELQLLGITGHARSGKSELIRHIVKKYDFVKVGASDIIRQSLQLETGRIEFSREELRNKGNELRQSIGTDFVIKAGLATPHNRIVFDGVRNLTAQKTLFANCGHMIGLVASPEKRYERSNYAKDNKVQPVSTNEMLVQEAPELNSTDRNGMQLLPVLWKIPPEAIIDTTTLSIDEVVIRADLILRAYGINPCHA